MLGSMFRFGIGIESAVKGAQWRFSCVGGVLLVIWGESRAANQNLRKAKTRANTCAK